MSPVRAALLLGSIGVVAAVACSFPSMGYQDTAGSGAATTHGSTSTSTGNSASGKAASSSTQATSTGTGGAGMGGAGTGGAGPDAGGMGGAGTGGAGGGTTGNGCLPGDVGKDPCDCDGDGDKANTMECDYDGGDCNDHDPLVNSKQTGWFTQMGSHGWDYNCDGQEEYEYPDTLSCDLFTCNTSTDEWSGGSTPDCGQMGPYAVCNLSFSFNPCAPGPNQGMRTQGCH